MAPTRVQQHRPLLALAGNPGRAFAALTADHRVCPSRKAAAAVRARTCGRFIETLPILRMPLTWALCHFNYIAQVKFICNSF